jgi:hypothetical protein
LADFVAEVGFGAVAYFDRFWVACRSSSAAVGHCGATTLKATRRTPRSCKARDGRNGRRASHKLGKPAQVLSDGCQRELELGAAWASQAQAAKPQNALEVGKQHLDLLAIATRPRKRFGLGERARDITRGLINAA